MKYVIISHTKDAYGDVVQTSLEIREENFIVAQGVFQVIASRGDVAEAVLYAVDEKSQMQVLCTKEELAASLEALKRHKLSQDLSGGIARL